MPTGQGAKTGKAAEDCADRAAAEAGDLGNGEVMETIELDDRENGGLATGKLGIEPRNEVGEGAERVGGWEMGWRIGLMD